MAYQLTDGHKYKTGGFTYLPTYHVLGSKLMAADVVKLSKAKTI
jgi:hypothetical protein